jgi:hypothetical protein
MIAGWHKHWPKHPTKVGTELDGKRISPHDNLARFLLDARYMCRAGDADQLESQG